jgi:rhodanese-related sulfurtransferase
VAKAAIPVQIFAIIGLSATLAGVHSLFVPVAIMREKSGFVIPGGNGAGVATQGDTDQADRPQEDPPMDPTDGAPPPDQSTAESDAAASDQDPANEPAQQPAEPGDGKISLEQAAELHTLAMNGQGVWFLDARRRENFDAGRVMGALYMEHTHVSSGEGLDEILSLSPPEFGDLLVIYCTGGDCQASEDTAILLEQAGYGNIAIMSAGYDEWAAAGLPTEGP